ncbi:MAG: hypothetical protein ABI548_21845 [Polyangiaceae bacterium]
MPLRPLIAALLFGAASALYAQPSVAQDQPSTPPAPRLSASREDMTTRPALNWYGWQTLAFDGAAGGLFLAAAADHDSTALYGASGIIYALGAPLVHVGHSQWEMGLASFGVRAVTPLLGAAVGSHYDHCQSASVTGGRSGACSIKWEVTGIAVGGLLAVALDALVLAYQPSRPVNASARNEQTAAPSAWASAAFLPKGVLLRWTAPL